MKRRRWMIFHLSSIRRRRHLFLIDPALPEVNPGQREGGVALLPIVLIQLCWAPPTLLPSLLPIWVRSVQSSPVLVPFPHSLAFSSSSCNSLLTNVESWSIMFFVSHFVPLSSNSPATYHLLSRLVSSAHSFWLVLFSLFSHSVFWFDCIER